MEESQVTGGDTHAAGGLIEQDIKTKFEKEKQDGIAYETYRKTVTQYKRAAEKNAELEAALAAATQDKMQAEGKKDELISALRKQTQDLESKYKQSQTAYSWNVIGAQIKAELASRGVGNPDKVLNYAKAAHKDDLGAIEVGDDYTVNRTDLSRFVDKFLNENQDLGFVSKVKVKDLSPGKVEMKKDDKKPLDKLSKDELMKVWAATQR
jgi:hypothetical protein